MTPKKPAEELKQRGRKPKSTSGALAKTRALRLDGETWNACIAMGGAADILRAVVTHGKLTARQKADRLAWLESNPPS